MTVLSPQAELPEEWEEVAQDLVSREIMVENPANQAAVPVAAPDFSDGYDASQIVF